MSRRSQAGVALIEFALVTPLLMLLLVGIVEFGRYMYYSVVVGNAANAGAHYGASSVTNAAQTGSTGGIALAAIADGQNNIKNITANAQDVCSCWTESTGLESPAPPTTGVCGSGCSSGILVTYVQVTTAGNYSSMFDYPGLPSTFTVGATAYMRVGQAP